MGGRRGRGAVHEPAEALGGCVDKWAAARGDQDLPGDPSPLSKSGAGGAAASRNPRQEVCQQGELFPTVIPLFKPFLFLFCLTQAAG